MFDELPNVVRRQKDVPDFDFHKHFGELTGVSVKELSMSGTSPSFQRKVLGNWVLLVITSTKPDVMEWRSAMMQRSVR